MTLIVWFSQVRVPKHSFDCLEKEYEQTHPTWHLAQVAFYLKNSDLY